MNTAKTSRTLPSLTDDPSVRIAATGVPVVWAGLTFAVLLGFARLSYGLLLPAIRTDLGGTYSTYGFIGTLNFIGYLVGTLALPSVLRYVSNRQGLNALATLATGVAMIGTACSSDTSVLSVLRLLVGLFSAPATVLTMSLTLERVRETERGRASGFVWLGGSFGIVLSGLVAPIIVAAGGSFGWRAAWAVMGIAGIGSAYGLWRVGARSVSQRGSMPSPQTRPSLRPLFQPRRLLFLTLAYVGFGCGYIIYFTYVISYIQQQGVAPLYAGLVWAVIGVMGMASGVVWGRAVDRWPNGLTLAAALVLGGVGAVGVIFQNIIITCIGAAVVGLCASIAPALLVTALLKRAVSDAAYTASFSTITATFAIGQISGPVIGGFIIERRDLVAAIITGGGILIGAAGCAVAYFLVSAPHSASGPVSAALPHSPQTRTTTRQ